MNELTDFDKDILFILKDINIKYNVTSLKDIAEHYPAFKKYKQYMEYYPSYERDDQLLIDISKSLNKLIRLGHLEIFCNSFDFSLNNEQLLQI